LGGPIVWLSAGVLVPVLLSSSVGIVALALWEDPKDIVLGVLSISLAAAAVGSAIVVTVLLGRRARAARLQSDLIANVSHELRTPLAAIRMYAQTLQSGGVAGDAELVRQCVDTIARETEWLDTTIEGLLTWRAAPRDRADLDLVTSPLSSLACEVAERFRRMIPPGDVDFQVRIDTNLPVAHDRSGIASILINLLTNAYKYSGQDKRIVLTAEDRIASVALSVHDNGAGIPRKELGRILEPFHRLGNGAGNVSGVGLGLAIVNHLVRAHSGTLEIESTQGSGSRFTVVLPAGRDEG